MITGSSPHSRADVLGYAGHGQLGVPDVRLEQFGPAVTVRDVRTQDRDPFRLRLVDPEPLRRRVKAFACATEDLAKDLQLPDLAVEPAKALHFLSYTKRAAYHCLVDCTRDQEELQAVVDFLTASIDTAWFRGWPLQVEIMEQDAEYLPWEWLGGLDVQTNQEAEAKSSLGFAAVVYRRDRQENQTGRSTYLTAEPLQVRFFRHPDLPGTEREKRFFNSSSELFRLLGPLPEPGGGLALIEPLANPLYSAPDGPDQVVHLSCQQETTPASLDGTLSFGGSFELRVTDLQERLGVTQKAPDSVERPLIFFNGCRGDFYPFTTRSLAGVLLHNGNRAVVSTSIRASDDVAATLGQFFYKRLLGGQVSAAEALLWAKWDLLSRRGSPLGLLYTYYGQPALHVAPIASIPSLWRSPAPWGSWCP